MNAPDISREHAERILARPKPSALRSTQHDHRVFTEGCFRCDLSRDEVNE